MTANNPWLPQQEYYKHFALNCVMEPDASAILRHLSEHIGEDKQTTLKQIALTAYGRYNSSTERKARQGTLFNMPVQQPQYQRHWEV